MTPFESLILDVIEGKAMSGFEIARAIESRIPGALAGREGSLYPALLALERGGEVIATWEMRESGRRRVYRRSLVREVEDGET
jgi:DNA-binding PadR family transcriptional regulator